MKYKLINIILPLLFLAGLFNNKLFAQERESLIKAGFIEKFTHFIQWPEESGNNDSQNHFIIKVIGENTLGNSLGDLFKSTSLKNRNVIIEYISSVEQIGECMILFISGSEIKNLSEILEYTTGKPILTIGDTKGFGQKGVLINLFNEGNYIRYEVNKNSIEKSGLKINSLLLSYAVIIESNG